MLKEAKKMNKKLLILLNSSSFNFYSTTLNEAFFSTKLDIYKNENQLKDFFSIFHDIQKSEKPIPVIVFEIILKVKKLSE